LFSASQIGTPEAIDFLIDVAKDDPETELRKKAIFWLGQSGDQRARQALLEIINE
jgi:HEAT repeat protein